MKRIFVFGLGYTGQVFAKRAAGFDIVGTVRTREAQLRLREKNGIEAFVFDGATFDPPLLDALAGANLLIASAPPSEAGDPALGAFADRIAAAPLQRVIYLSTVGVYGGADGEWVDESAPTLGSSSRARSRIRAEQQWRDFSHSRTARRLIS